MSKQWYGSLQNRMMERGVVGQPVPTIGMGVTMFGYSDRHAGTISTVEYIAKDRYRIGVQRDKATVIKGSIQDGSAEYEYTAQPDGYVTYYQQDKQGMWSQVYLNDATGRWKKREGAGLRIGERDEYYDPSF